MEIEVIHLVQSGKDLFVGVIKARDLFVDQVKVERWFPEKSRAYQRAVRDQKVGKIAQFVRNSKGIMPSSILLSVRDLGTGGFRRHGGGSSGILEIPEDKEIFVVDGQHRIEGLRHAVNNYGATEFEDYPLPVVFLCPSLWREHADPEVEEGKQFITINKMQTGVKGDLVDVFLLALTNLERTESALATTGLPEDIVKMIRPRVRALLTTLILNSLPAWRGLVSRPNVRGGGTVIGQKAMVDSLVDLVNSADYVRQYPHVGPLAIALSQYWEAILDYYPTAKADPKHYWVQKRLGAYVFHRIFPRVDALATSKTKTGYTAALSRAAMKDERYWSKEGNARRVGTGYTAVTILANEIWPPPPVSSMP
jgi:DGQHR domain-containing protein